MRGIGSPSSVSPTELVRARARTERLLEGLTDDQLTTQYSPLQSPLGWDLAHIGYFEQLWLLEGERDDLYESFTHPRSERGDLPMPSPAEVRESLACVRERVLARVPGLDDSLVRMVVQHELQHAETMAQTMVIAGLLTPTLPPVQASGEALVEAGRFTLGSDDPWAYDNERPAHEVELTAFRIDRALVTNAEFGRESGEPDAPVQHVSFDEAEAHARSVGRRLPTEAEWEKAAKAGVLEHATGAVWQWTSTHFDGYPGFRADPYREYSEVFFGTQYRVLRGGSWATDPLVARPSFRNWDLPQRKQIFSGIRLACDA